MTSNPVYFRSRNKEVKGLVQDYGAFSFVNFSENDAVKDFTGSLKFESKKYIPGYVLNKEAKDVQDLLRAVGKQLP
jgi:hypothetical protein